MKLQQRTYPNPTNQGRRNDVLSPDHREVCLGREVYDAPDQIYSIKGIIKMYGFYPHVSFTCGFPLESNVDSLPDP